MSSDTNQMKEIAERNLRAYLANATFASDVDREAALSCVEVLTETPQSELEVDLGSADDIRAMGWSVAVHNDYRLNGESHTFWLFTNGDKCVKGEGKTDAQALNIIRSIIDPVMFNGLTRSETCASASVCGLSPKPATSQLWIIERSSKRESPPYRWWSADEPNSPKYWLGEWVDDKTKATRYATEEAAEREVANIKGNSYVVRLTDQDAKEE